MPPLLLALVTIFVFQLGGELLSRFAQLPVPGPVIGMVALVFGFALSPRLLALVRPVAQNFLSHLSLLFIPAGVGIVGQWDALKTQLPALFVAVAVSTVLALAVSALVFQWVARATGNRPPADGERLQ